MKRYFLTFSGRVQGVGFRFFAQSAAINFSITGYVRNMSDGSVTVEAQGNESEVHKFISTLREGNRFIRVDNLSIEEMPPVLEEKKFRVNY